MRKTEVKLKNTFELNNTNNNIVPRYNPTTGLMIGARYDSLSGFRYMNGIRELKGLRIQENIAEGTAVVYINSIQVFDKKGTLIIDKPFKRNTHYSRGFVKKTVLNELIPFLTEAARREGKEIDGTEVRHTINELLTGAYYQKSYEAILDWANEIGIKIN